MDKHPGTWKNKSYQLGRFVSGGFWTCCGVQEQLASACTVSIRLAWKEYTDDVDAHQATETVKNAFVTFYTHHCPKCKRTGSIVRV